MRPADVLVGGVILAISTMMISSMMPYRCNWPAARRTQCLNNVRQIALATLQYAHTHSEQLPPLAFGPSGEGGPSARDEADAYSWRVALLPYLDEHVRFNELNLSATGTATENQEVVRRVIPAFLCPESPDFSPEPRAIRPSDRSLPGGTAAGCSYEVVGGVRTRPGAANPLDFDGVAFGPWGEPTFDAESGALLSRRVARIADITDDPHRTILVAERIGRPDLYVGRALAKTADQLDPSRTSTDRNAAAWAIATPFPRLIVGYEQSINSTNAGIYSWHPGGAVVAMADGSARFLAESTPASVLRALITRSGSEAVDLRD